MYDPISRRTPEETAAYLGVRPATLAVWRCTGRYNLPFYKAGRKVYYQQSDLDAFIERMTHNPGEAA